MSYINFTSSNILILSDTHIIVNNNKNIIDERFISPDLKVFIPQSGIILNAELELTSSYMEHGIVPVYTNTYKLPNLDPLIENINAVKVVPVITATALMKHCPVKISNLFTICKPVYSKQNGTLVGCLGLVKWA